MGKSRFFIIGILLTSVLQTFNLLLLLARESKETITLQVERRQLKIQSGLVNKDGFNEHRSKEDKEYLYEHRSKEDKENLYEHQSKQDKEYLYEHRSKEDKGNLYERRSVIKIQASSQELLLLTAVVTNTSAFWNVVTVQGWIKRSHSSKTTFYCCTQHRDGVFKFQGKAQTQHWIDYLKAPYGATQFQCELTQRNLTDLPIGVTIFHRRGLAPNDCPKAPEKYVKTEFAYKQKGIAVFLKVLYSALNYNDLLAWFEIHRLLGIDKVLVYVTDDLNKNATRVLQYYKRLGLLKAIHYPIPGNVSVMYMDTAPCWNFKGVSSFDAHARLRGYNYVISVDPDEYVIPKNSSSFMALFDSMVNGKRRAAGFTFKTVLFIKNWGVQKLSDFTVGRYLNRSKPTEDRVKHVTIPSRVPLGGVRSHNFKTGYGYKKYIADTEDVTLYHYRDCREIWVKEKNHLDCLKMERYTDDKALMLLRTVQTNIYRIKSVIGL